ncbi:MAG: hypothetical protein JO165_11145 [Candidatus Eremiobacteraeota bacterium]|nr:hypothetical protein [Candidatus Eremiobacteraeota bacterium]
MDKLGKTVAKAAKTPAGRTAIAAAGDVATAAIDIVAETAKRAVSGRRKGNARTTDTKAGEERK